MAVCVQAIEKIHLETAEQLKQQQMEQLFFDIEMPLMTVLAEMQHIGCKADADQLRLFGEQLTPRIQTLTDEF